MMAMNKVEFSDDEESAARAEQAIGVMIGAFEALAAKGSVQSRPGTGRTLRASFGWWAGMTRSSQAVVTLRRAGLAHEAAPIVRSILQHSLVLQWMVDVGDAAIDAVAEYGDDNTRLLIDTAKKASWDLPEGVGDDLPPKPGTANPLVKKIKIFEQLCTQYGAGELYVTFRILSAYAHPTATGAMAYVDQASGTPASRSTSPTRAYVLQTALCLAQAGRVIDSMLVESPLAEDLGRVDELLGAEIRPWPTPA